MVAPGDKVVLTPIAPCGRCYWCVRGQPGCCVNNAAVLGGTFLDGSTGLSRGGQQVYRGLGVGGFAEYAHDRRDRRGEGARRHAARDRVRDRLRGADRRGRGAQHRRGRAGRDRARARPRRHRPLGRAGGAGRRRRADHRQRPARLAARGRRCSIGATDRRSTPAPTTSLAATRDLTERRRRLRVRVRGGRPRSPRRASRPPAPAGRPCSWARRRSRASTSSTRWCCSASSEKKLMGCFLGSCNSLRDIPRMVGHVAGGPARPRGAGHRTAGRSTRSTRPSPTSPPACGIRTVIDLELSRGRSRSRASGRTLPPPQRIRQRQQVNALGVG